MTTLQNSLRLAFSIQHFPPYVGGAERQAQHMVATLSLRVMEATVITTRFDRDLARKESLGSFAICRLPTVKNKVLKLAVNFICGFAYYLARGYRYDIVHCHCFSPFNLGAVLASKFWGYRTLVKVCAIGACGDIQRIKQMPFGCLIWSLYRMADCFIAPTTQVAKELVAEGADITKIEIIPNAFSLPPRANRGNSKKIAKSKLGLGTMPTFLYVGRLSVDKNLEILLSAWSRLVSRHQAKLVIVGDGPLSAKIACWRQSGDWSDSVLLAGSQDDPAPYYQAADIFVFPSRSESFGNVIVEAMSYGLALVTTRVGVLLEWPDAAGRLQTFSGDDVDELVEKLEHFILRPLDGESTSDPAGMLISDQFDPEQIAGRYLQLYDRLLYPRQ